MAAQLDLCAACRRGFPTSDSSRFDRPTQFSLAVVPFRYAYPVDHFVRALKFRGDRLYARVLAALLADAISHARSNHDLLPEVIVPVPLHPSRYRERGFNQAHEIARYLAALLRLRVDAKCLVRVLPTREQSGLSLVERTQNVRGAFALARPPSARRIALVDDVLTTGSTASEAARVLMEGGASELELWAAACVSLE